MPLESMARILAGHKISCLHQRLVPTLGHIRWWNKFEHDKKCVFASSEILTHRKPAYLQWFAYRHNANGVPSVTRSIVDWCDLWILNTHSPRPQRRAWLSTLLTILAMLAHSCTCTSEGAWWFQSSAGWYWKWNSTIRHPSNFDFAKNIHRVNGRTTTHKI